MKPILRASRYLLVVTVVGCIVMFAVVTIYAAVAVASTIRRSESEALPRPTSPAVTVAAFKILDLFLLGTILYIVALGLAALFLDSEAALPRWFKVARAAGSQDRSCRSRSCSSCSSHSSATCSSGSRGRTSLLSVAASPQSSPRSHSCCAATRKTEVPDPLLAGGWHATGYARPAVEDRQSTRSRSRGKGATRGARPPSSPGHCGTP